MPELNSTLGAALLGCLVAAVFYGLTSVQTLIYFQGNSRDRKTFKCGIFILWVLDTIHMALTAHAVYFYLIENFGNYSVLEAPTWSILINVYVTNFSDVIVRGYFARRVSLLCGSQWPFLRLFIPTIIAVLSMIIFVCATGFASRAFQLHTFDRMSSVSIYLYVGFVAAVAADLTIAISLCALLFHCRTGIKRTDSVLTILMAFSINAGLLTSFATLACLVTYALWPRKLIYVALYFALSKLYVNSLLASVNARSSLQKKGATNTAPQIDLGTRLTALRFSMRCTMPEASSSSIEPKGEPEPNIMDTEMLDQDKHHGSEDDEEKRHGGRVIDSRTTPA